MDPDHLCAQRALSKKFPRKRCLSDATPVPECTPSVGVLTRADSPGDVKPVEENARILSSPNADYLNTDIYLPILRPLSPSTLEYGCPLRGESASERPLTSRDHAIEVRRKQPVHNISANQQLLSASSEPEGLCRGSSERIRARVSPHRISRRSPSPCPYDGPPRSVCHRKKWVQDSTRSASQSPVSDSSHSSDLSHPIEELQLSANDSVPICLTTATRIIKQACAHRVSDPNQTDASLDTNFTSHVYKQTKKRRQSNRNRNAFHIAHMEMLGEMAPSSSVSDPPQIGEPPELIRILSDYGDDEDSGSDGSTTETDDDSSSIYEQYPDTSAMSTEQILSIIHMPDLVPYTPDINSVNDYLEPHQVGHINHLIKCYADAVFTINIPESVFDSKAFSPIDYFDIHICGVLQVYFIMFKSEDFLTLGVGDQITLLQCGMLPALISLGFPLYRPESKTWSVPTAIGERRPFSFGIYNLLQILPKPVVTRTVALHETSHKLNIDWTISMLLLFIFIFTPVRRTIQDMDAVDRIRDTYVKLLYKYIQWKCGSDNVVLIFPEILKLMDAILRHSQDIKDFELWLKEEEVDALHSRMSSLDFKQQLIVGDQLETCNIVIDDDSPLGHISFSTIHSKISASLLRHLLIPSSNIDSKHLLGHFRQHNDVTPPT